MNKAGSYRTGWNARGGTWRDDLEYAQDQAQKNNPDSRYWYSLAEAECIKLRHRLGESYASWAEGAMPGDIEQYTAKQIYEIVHAKLEELDISNSRHWSDDPKYYGGEA